MTANRMLRHPVARIVVLAALIVTIAAACSEDGEGGSAVSSIIDSGEVTLPEATTPPPTDAPAVPETPAPEETTEDNTLAFVLALILIVLVAIGIGTAIGGRSRKREESPGHRDAQATRRDSDVNTMLATASWLHDSASLDVLGASPGQASMKWQSVRTQVAELQTRAGALALGSGSPELDTAASALSQAAGSLAGAMDSYVSMETQKGAGEAVSDELLADAKNSVMARRQELQRAIGRVTAAR